MQRFVYELSEPMGRNFDQEFKPELTLQEMLELRVFGGHYFEGEQDEFPRDWFAQAKLSDTHDPSLNYFGVDASQPREE